MKKEALVVADKETGLEIVHGLISRSEDRTKPQCENDNSSFERTEQFKYLGATLTYPNAFLKKLRAD